MEPIKEYKQDHSPACERISRMEQLFDHASEAVAELSKALENYQAAQEAIATLSDYYGSDEWKQDFADDEAGLLPADLKRGVLSEDGIWNLLTDVHGLTEQIKQCAHL